MSTAELKLRYAPNGKVFSDAMEPFPGFARCLRLNLVAHHFRQRISGQ